MYEERVLESEKGTFIPLIFTTSGGSGPLCRKFMKRLASRIADKKNEEYKDVIFHLRVRLRFAILRSTLMALRGQRGRRLKGVESVDEVSFNIIPEAYNQRVNNR